MRPQCWMRGAGNPPLPNAVTQQGSPAPRRLPAGVPGFPTGSSAGFSPGLRPALLAATPAREAPLQQHMPNIRDWPPQLPYLPRSCTWLGPVPVQGHSTCATSPALLSEMRAQVKWGLKAGLPLMGGEKTRLSQEVHMPAGSLQHIGLAGAVLAPTPASPCIQHCPPPRLLQGAQARGSW